MSQRSTLIRPRELSAQAAELSIQAAELFAAANALQDRAEALGERVRLFYEIVALTREVFTGRLYEVAETISRCRPEGVATQRDSAGSSQ